MVELEFGRLNNLFYFVTWQKWILHFGRLDIFALLRNMLELDFGRLDNFVLLRNM